MVHDIRGVGGMLKTLSLSSVIITTRGEDEDSRHVVVDIEALAAAATRIAPMHRALARHMDDLAS